MVIPIREQLRIWANELGGTSSTALLDVEWMAAKVLGISRTKLLLWSEPLREEQTKEITKMVERRKTGEPMAYIIGEKEFMSLPFSVEPGVLIPRPDTETLVEWVIHHGGKRILDIGTGSGAIGVSLAYYLPEAEVTCLDISPIACRVAEENAKRNGVSVTVKKADIRKDEILGKYDVIVSNPPYIRESEIAGLARDVRDFEPHLALSGGADGLDFYRILAEKAPNALSPKGLLLVECGYDQTDAVEALFRPHFGKTEMLRDLAGNPRVVIGMRTNECLA